MAGPRVFLSRSLPDPGLQLLLGETDLKQWTGPCPPTEEQLIGELAEAEGYLSATSDPVTARVLASPRLRVISQFGVGYDNIDLAAATSRGIAVCNTPDVLTEAVADLALGLLIAAARQLVRGDRLARSGRWQEMGLAREVHGRTLGLVGLGRIGQAVARRARAFGMKLLYHDLALRPECEQELGIAFVSLAQLLRESDFVSLHLPLNPATRRLISERELGLMKQDAILINTSRGGIVDQAALVRALQDKKIGGAALDVFEVEPLPASDPLIRLENVLLAPHIGSATVATREEMAILAAENLLAVLAGKRPRCILNPEVLAGAAG